MLNISKNILVLSAVFIVSNLGYSQIQQAENHFDKGEFAQAASSYQQAIEASTESSDTLLYNLGNASYQSNDLGRSVSAYLAARKLSPRDPDIRANLNQALKKIQDDLTAVEKYPVWMVPFKWMLSYTPAEWLSLACGVLLLGALLFTTGAYVPKLFTLRKPGQVLGGLALFLLIGFSVSASYQRDWACVTSMTTSAFSGPTDNSSKLFDLHVGAPVMVDEMRQGWAKVVLAKGEKGWVRAQDILNLN